MPVALVLALGAVGADLGLDDPDDLSGRASLVAAAGAVGLVVRSASTVLFVRRPGVVRARGDLHAAVPDPGADRQRRDREPAAAALRRDRRGRARAPVARVARRAEDVLRDDPRARRLTQALAIVVVALRGAGALLLGPRARGQDARLLLRAVRGRLSAAGGGALDAAARAAGAAVTVGLALLFAAVGFVEWATGRLLISNEKVLSANDLKPYFRVNSLFFDPNVYGRFLALVMVVLAGVAAVGAGAARRRAGGGGAGAAVGGAGADAVGVELRGAAGRAGGAGRAALAPLAGVGGVRRRGRGRAGARLIAPGPWASRPTRSRRAQRGVERAGEADPRRGGHGGRPAGLGFRLGLVRRPVPRARARACPRACRPSRTRSR